MALDVVRIKRGVRKMRGGLSTSSPGSASEREGNEAFDVLDDVRLITRVQTFKDLGIFSIYISHARLEIPNRYLRFTQLPRFKYITDF